MLSNQSQNSLLLDDLQITELIEKANKEWDERNDRAVEEGDEKLERMLPLVRLKVHTMYLQRDYVTDWP
jgi:hypothetical protein